MRVGLVSIEMLMTIPLTVYSTNPRSLLVCDRTMFSVVLQQITFVSKLQPIILRIKLDLSHKHPESQIRTLQE